MLAFVFGTVPPIFSPKMFEKQDGMLAFFYSPFFWYCASDFPCKNVLKTSRNARLFFGTVPPIFSPTMCEFPPIFVILGVRGYPWHPLGGHRDRDPVFLRILGGFGAHFGDPGRPLGLHVPPLCLSSAPFAPRLRRFLATSVADLIFPSLWGAHWREKVTFSGRADVLET